MILYNPPNITYHSSYKTYAGGNVMSNTEERRERQLAFLETGENIVVGHIEDLPLPIDEIKRITNESACVREYFSGGLTAEVFKIEIDGKFYTLKKKRKTILVKNVDGQTSFLNEVQRRSDFERLRVENKELDRGIVKTIYASLYDEFILSEWIEGTGIKIFTRELFREIFALLIAMEVNGIMEWDVCSGNLLLTEEGTIKLFDFGYTYLFDPLTEFNSEGKQAPLFHAVERLETRFFMQYLLDLEIDKGLDEALAVYQIEKEEAIKAYKVKWDWLQEHHAEQDILEYLRGIIQRWETGLQSKNALKDLYDLERFRSYTLDVHDDISGQSCTLHTLDKVNEILKIMKEKHDFMRRNEGYLWDDLTMGQSELINKYEELKKKVLQYQIHIDEERKYLIIVYSYHHNNTRKVADEFAKVMNATVITPEQVKIEELEQFDMVGFGAGIDSGKHYMPLLDVVDKLPQSNQKEVFIFSTSAMQGEGKVAKDHAALRDKLLEKNYLVVGEFSCKGFNTNSVLKYIGGMNKGKPDQDDLRRAREFALKLLHTRK